MIIKQGQCDKEACQVAGCGFKVGGHAGRLTNFLGVCTGKSWSEKSWSEKKVGQKKKLTLFPRREIGMPTALAVGTVRRSVSEYAV